MNQVISMKYKKICNRLNDKRVNGNEKGREN